MPTSPACAAATRALSLSDGYQQLLATVNNAVANQVQPSSLAACAARSQPCPWDASTRKATCAGHSFPTNATSCVYDAFGLWTEHFAYIADAQEQEANETLAPGGGRNWWTTATVAEAAEHPATTTLQSLVLERPVFVPAACGQAEDMAVLRQQLEAARCGASSAVYCRVELHAHPNPPEDAPSAPTTTRRRPHVLLMLADDWGSYDASFRIRSLGREPDVRTPHIDALAGAGVTFANYYVQPICSPTRASLLSGRYSVHTGSEHRLWGSSEPSCLPVRLPLLPRAFQALNYSAHMVGKWHLGYVNDSCAPWTRGFDTYLGCARRTRTPARPRVPLPRTPGPAPPAPHAPAPSALTSDLNGNEGYFKHGISSGMDFHECRGGGAGAVAASSSACDGCALGYEGRYSTHVYAERVQQLLRGWRAGAPPLFVYLAWQAVHEPMEVPSRYLAPFGRIEDPSRRLYAGMLLALDEGIANISATLRTRQMLNDTVLALTNDNGGMSGSYGLGCCNCGTSCGGLNYPYRGWKDSFYEGGRARPPAPARRPRPPPPRTHSPLLLHPRHLPSHPDPHLLLLRLSRHRAGLRAGAAARRPHL